MVCFATQHNPTVQFAHYCVCCVGLDSDFTLVRTEYNSVKIIAYVGTVNYLMQLPLIELCIGQLMDEVIHVTQVAQSPVSNYAVTMRPLYLEVLAMGQ